MLEWDQCSPRYPKSYLPSCASEKESTAHHDPFLQAISLGVVGLIHLFRCSLIAARIARRADRSRLARSTDPPLGARSHGARDTLRLNVASAMVQQRRAPLWSDDFLFRRE